MIKMRHWQFNLNRVKGNCFKDIFTDNYSRPVDVDFSGKIFEKCDENKLNKKPSEIESIIFFILYS